MTSITVDLTRQGRHWNVQLAVNGEIHARRIFGCSEALTPLVSGLLAADAENATIGTHPEGDRPVRPATITVSMPSGRVLTFALRSVQHSVADMP
jgi:hypothetical protein